MKIVNCFLGFVFTKIENKINDFKSCYKTEKLRQTGKNIKISGSTMLRYSNNISVGNSTYINGGYIFAGDSSKIIIGENCLISYNVHIRTDTHNYLRKDQLINEQGHTEKDIIIGNDVWIGFGAQILSGVKIGDGAIIGAGAIVTKNVAPYDVVVGIPARSIKKRG